MDSTAITFTSTPATTETLPQVPGYTVERKLGSGGMGEVFLGRQDRLDRPVAIKLLRLGIDPSWSGAVPLVIETSQSEEARQRFQREAKLMARLSHPHIVTVFDCGTFQDRDYLVFEFVEGQRLRDLMQDSQPLPLDRTLELLSELAEAVKCLHSQGILHRDLKPENVLLTRDGHVKVTDFGIAVPLSELGQMTLNQQCLGTLDYMAPEQRARLPLDERADQYALAVIAYEMLTGHRPLGRYEAPSTLNAAVPVDVDEVLQRALDNDPDDRFPTVAEFHERLRLAFRPGAKVRDWRKPALMVGFIAELLAALWLFSLGVLGDRETATQPIEANETASSLSQANVAPDVSPVVPPVVASKDIRTPVVSEPGVSPTEPTRTTAASNWQDRFQKAVDLNAEKRFVEALEHMNVAVVLNPENPDLHKFRGKLQQQLGDAIGAEVSYTAVLDRLQDSETFFLRGYVRSIQNKFQDGLTDYSESLRLRPGVAVVHNNRGQIYFNLGNYDAAFREYEQALNLEPQGLHPHLGIARVHLARDEEFEALDHMRTAIETAPENVEALTQLSRLLSSAKNLRLREPEEALSLALKARDLTKRSNPIQLEVLALAYAANNDFENAAYWLERGIQRATPDDAKKWQPVLDEYLLMHNLNVGPPQ